MSILTLLSNDLGISENELKSLLVNAPRKYKVYSIPKRTGGKRTIAQPIPALKQAQRSFNKCINLNVHEAAMAYRTGLSIKENANIHRKNPYLLKMDLENFFNSITPSLLWLNLKKQNIEFNLYDNHYLENLLFWRPRKSSKIILSVGAPSSPYVSNSLMYNFDITVHELCSDMHIKYSRYADDLTFSTREKNHLFEVPKVINNLLMKEFGNNLTINTSKTVFSSKAHNRHVTGITIDNEGKLSLGRAKKRYIKHLVHKFSFNLLDDSEVPYLKGLLSHANHIEPDFIVRLQKKYSDEIIQCLINGTNR